MDVDNQNDDQTLFNPNRAYRVQTKIPLGTMEVPAHLNKTSTSRSNDQDRRQLESRNRNKPRLERRAEETEAAYARAQDEYDEFVELTTQYRDAENARNPTDQQSRVIREINVSVQSINLTGPDDGTPEIGRKMAEKLLSLKKVMDTAWTAWNAAEKVNFFLRHFLKKFR